jgi:hypothetical protein
VIWSAALRDTLLVAADWGLYLPIWSHQILDEMTRTLKRWRPDLDPARIDRLANVMNREFPEALVQDLRSSYPP